MISPLAFARSRTLVPCLLSILAAAPPARAAGVVISEIHYNPREGSALEFVELHNPTGSDIALGGWAFVKGIRHEFEAGTVIPRGGYLVLAKSPEALSGFFGIPASGILAWVDSSLDNGGEKITLADAAGRVVDEVTYDNQPPWDPDADGDGPSLQRLCMTASPDVPTNWAAESGVDPTPLAANRSSLCPPPLLPAPKVAINEIHYHPLDDRDAELEYVEITNTTAAPIDLLGYCFTQGIDFCFDAQKMLAPGEYLVVCRNEAAVRSIYGITNTIGDFAEQLSNDGERVTLLDRDFQLADSVRYGESGEWPVVADGLGSSIEKIVASAPSDDPASWTDGGSLAPVEQSAWMTASATGIASSDTLYFYVEDDGEFLIDDVSLVNIAAPATNYIGNGSFDSGIAGWQGVGNHASSRWSRAAGGTIYDEAALHIIATDPGTGSANSVRTLTVTPLDRSPGVTYRLTFSYKHLSGSSRLVSRLSGASPGAGLFYRLGTSPSAVVTPGEDNLSLRSVLPPFISQVARVPREPKSSDQVTVTARVRGVVTGVKLIATLRSGAQEIPMSDDGLSGDGAAADGVYGVRIPAQPHDTAVTFRIEAASPDGTRVSPSPTDTMPVHGYYVNNDQPASLVPLFNLLLPTTNPRSFISSLDCFNYVTCSFAHQGDLYHDIGIRGRGQSVCGTFKRFLKVKFHRGHEFQGQRRVNLQSLWTDKSLIREHLSWEMFGEMAAAYGTHDYVRIHANGSYFGLYAALEHLDARFLDRNGLNQDGNLYKAVASTEQVGGEYEKKTNQDGDYSDLIDFLDDLHATPAAGLVNFFRQRVDEDAMIEYQATQVLINNRDYPHKNHYLYHDTASGKWMPIAWDVDLTFGKMWDGTYGGVLNDKMDTPGITPWYTTNVRGEGTGNHLTDKFFSQAGTWYRRAYLVRLWDALLEKGTVDTYEDKILALSDLIYEEQLDDIAAWGRSSPTANDPGAPAGFEPNLDRVRAHIATRRSYLINYLRNTERFTGHDRLKITEVMYNPVGGEDSEFLELWNNSGTAIDVSGWTIEGLEERDLSGTVIPFRFPAESDIAAGEVIIVAKDPAAFADRYGNVARVFGPYPGNLDNAGEALRVKDDGPGYPATVDYLEYKNESPWPIRPDGFGPSLELTGIHPDVDNDLPRAWRSSVEPGGSPGVIHLPGDGVRFRRGNCNADQVIDISDGLTILLYLFAGRGAPPCIDGCDVNSNQSVGIEDAILILQHLFAPLGATIPSPGPGECLPAREGFCEQSNCTG